VSAQSIASANAQLGHTALLLEPEAGDQLARMSERPVRDRASRAIERDPLAYNETLRPSAMCRMPALRNALLYLRISAYVSGVDGRPFSLSAVAFTKAITRIRCLSG
jgi:hypothetical protein